MIGAFVLIQSMHCVARWGNFVSGESKEKNKWCAQGDDFRTFLSDFVAVLPHIEIPAELAL
jgi:hypothetical protein